MGIARLSLLVWLAAGSMALADWTTLEDARLKADPANDGDSFHVMHGGREYIFRLYFVDSPEAENSFPERVQEQADYWNIEPSRVLAAGEEAAQFTRSTLAGRKLTIETRWEDAKGNSSLPRYYAFVTVEGKDYAQVLTAQGHTRVYGNMVDHPRGMSRDAISTRLDALARQAKAKRAGLWAKVPAPVTDGGGGYETGGSTDPIDWSSMKPAGKSATPAQTIKVPKRATAYTVSPPFRPLGTFEAGTALEVVRTLDQGMVHVKYVAPGGKVTHAACKQWEVGLDTAAP